MMESPEKRPLFLKIYLALLAIITVAYGVMNLRINSDWVIGDWLINYQAGFVRRGLVGEVVFITGHICHVPLGIVVVALQLACSGMLLYAIWKLFPARPQWWMWLLLLSPATLAFPILDPPAAFHKEQLHFAGLGFLLLLLRRPSFWQSSKQDKWLVLYLSFVCTFSVLSHEALVVYAPYYLAALLIAFRDVKRALQLIAIPALLTLVAVGVSSRYHGDGRAAETVCSSIGGRLTDPNVGICGGSIYYLSVDPANARSEVAYYVEADHYYQLYLPLLLLSLLPLPLAYFDLRREPDCRFALWSLSSITLLACAASAVLFLYGTDWGRWIYIHLLSILLLLLAVEDQRLPSPRRAPLAQTPLLRACATLLLIAYATTWNLPALAIYRPRHGYVGLITYARSYKALHRQ